LASCTRSRVLTIEQARSIAGSALFPGVPPVADASLQRPNSRKYTLGLTAMRIAGTEITIESVYTLLASTRTGLIVLALLGASLPSSGESCSGPAPMQAAIHAHATAEAYIALGSWFSENHKPDCAAVTFESALKVDPTSKKALDGLAKALIATGDYEAAINHLRATPRDERLTIDLGNALKGAGQTDEAVQVWNAGIRTYPNSDLLVDALVSFYLQDAQYEVASKVAGQLAGRKPADLEAQRLYLHTLTVTGNDAVATPLAHKLLALAPHDPDILQLNGFLERKAGNDTAARKHLEEAIAVKPGDASTRANLGILLAQTHEPATAKVQLEKAIALGATEPQVRFELAKVLRQLGETEEAQQQLELYKKQLKQSSDKYEAMLKASEAAQAAKKGDNQKAADLYREACAVEPNDASLSYRLALVLAELGDVQGERAALEQAIKVNPAFTLAQYQLGYLEFQAGNDRAAERQFRITVEALPSNVQAWCSLASTLARQSRFQEAQAAVANALKLEPKNATALRLNQMLSAAMNQH